MSSAMEKLRAAMASGTVPHYGGYEYGYGGSTALPANMSMPMFSAGQRNPFMPYRPPVLDRGDMVDLWDHYYGNYEPLPEYGAEGQGVGASWAYYMPRLMDPRVSLTGNNPVSNPYAQMSSWGSDLHTGDNVFPEVAQDRAKVGDYVIPNQEYFGPFPWEQEYERQGGGGQ